MQYLKIPKRRVPMLIGKDGEVKKELEKYSQGRIEVTSEGEVRIHEESMAPLARLKVRDVVKAIGRGFSPRKAFKLFDPDVYLKLIELKDYVGKKPKQLRRVKARVIGSGGKTRKIIEELSGAKVSVYGKTIGVLGNLSALRVACGAIELLIKGSKHSTVYRYLERARR